MILPNFLIISTFSQVLQRTYVWKDKQHLKCNVCDLIVYVDSHIPPVLDLYPHFPGYIAFDNSVSVIHSPVFSLPCISQ